MKKFMVLDTNLIRRLLENNIEIEEKLDELVQGYDFVLSDLSLFEILDYIIRLPF